MIALFCGLAWATSAYDPTTYEARFVGQEVWSQDGEHQVADQGETECRQQHPRGKAEHEVDQLGQAVILQFPMHQPQRDAKRHHRQRRNNPSHLQGFIPGPGSPSFQKRSIAM